PGREHPVEACHMAELICREHFDVFHSIQQFTPHLVKIGPWRQLHQDEISLVLAQSGIGLSILESRENVRRSRERPDAARETDHPRTMAVDLKDLAHSRDAKFLLIEFVEDD